MRLRRAVRVSGLVAVVVGLGYAAVRAPDLLRGLDFFRIERVEIAGVRVLAPHEVLAASGVHRGQSVWDDPAPWLAALRAHPGVRDAEIERSLPRTIHIRVDERRPVALVDGGALRLATADGRLLPADPAVAEVDLPLVRGAVGDGERVSDETTLRLLTEAERVARLDPALAARISEIRAEGDTDILLVFGEPALEVVIPPGIAPEQLRRLDAVLADLARRGQPDRSGTDGLRVDARFRDQIVVRLTS
jgi:cell division protein FtsQ